MQGTRGDGASVVLDEQGPRSGSIESPIREVVFDELIPSWNTRTPSGTWIETFARVRSDGAWTGWYSFGEWSSDVSMGHRRSVNGQQDSVAKVSTDTLQLRRTADAYQLRVDLHSTANHVSPRLTLAAAVTTVNATMPRSGVSDRIAPPMLLDVPERSQMIYPGGGEVWCSPTSTSMVMAYWSAQTGNAALDRPVPEVADGTYDPVYRGTGNWPFNTAYASEAGLSGYVSRAGSIGEIERWLAAGVPVIASLGWSAGQLPEAPIASTRGHLLVIVGVNERGDVIVNDPAADTRRGQRVRRVYNRASFESLWLSHSGGTVYLIHPVDQVVPL
ncbi:MAG: peptidase C39 family protein [Chloroflexota bacterium]